MRDEDTQAFYAISIVSRMLRIHPQTIRHYERLGLVRPQRTEGNMRLFSRQDVRKLEQIVSFTNLGVNLAGVEIIVNLLDRMQSLQQAMENDLKRMREEIEYLRRRLVEPGPGATGSAGSA